MEGRKDDLFGKPGQKPRWDLLPWGPLSEVVDVLTYGAVKYGDNNWLRVDDYRARYVGAAMRHFVAYLRGQDSDAESGCRSLAHAIACLLFLMERDSHGGSK